jgi:hypothetical protein
MTAGVWRQRFHATDLLPLSLAGEGWGGGRGGEAIAGVEQGRHSASPSPPSPASGEGVYR